MFRVKTLQKRSLASSPRRVLALGSVPLIAPGLKVCLGALGEQDPPGSLKVGAGLIEMGGGAAGAFARPAARIEAATPLPSGRRAWRNRADDHVVVIAPARLRHVGIAAPR
jgi:hypothetical protein